MSKLKKWLQKPENQDYFQGPGNVQRVQQWRAKNPGYSRKPRSALATAVPLQDSLIPQAIENKEETINHKHPGSSPPSRYSPLFIGVDPVDMPVEREVFNSNKRNSLKKQIVVLPTEQLSNRFIAN